MRAISQMALGISIFQLYKYMIGREWTLPKKILLQVFELFAIWRFIDLTYHAGVGINNFRRIPFVAIIILLSFVNVTFLSKLLNRKFMESLGKLTLSIFIIHFPIAVGYFSFMWRLRFRGPGTPSGGYQGLPMFLRRTIGMNEYGNPISISIADIVIYLGATIIVTLLMHLIIRCIKSIISKRRNKAEVLPPA
jgi:peptidoglycan/LPS O-acetylase OafA/YrhL